MKVRIIQLINNFYRDEQAYAANERTKALGTYCSFGYFDAIEVQASQSLQNVRESSIWKEINNLTLGTLDGTCRKRNLICITDNDEKDDEFWQKEMHYPYLFVSLIRLKHTMGEPSKASTIMKKINEENETAIAYYSYNHSELILLKFDDHYSSGLNFILDKRRQLDILNMYSIFSVRENILTNENSIKQNILEEHVDVRFHMIVKDDMELTKFLNLLMEILSPNKKITARKYYTLGSCDMLVEISDINIQNLLFCYRMGNLMTHSNQTFEQALYNVETEILLKGEPLLHGKLDTK